MEDGATRNFEPIRTAEEQAKREQAAIEEEEKNNPMKVNINLISRGSSDKNVNKDFLWDRDTEQPIIITPQCK